MRGQVFKKEHERHRKAKDLHEEATSHQFSVR